MRNRRKQDSQRKGRGVWDVGGVKHNCPLASYETVKAFEHPCWTSHENVFRIPAAREASGLLLGGKGNKWFSRNLPLLFRCFLVCVWPGNWLSECVLPPASVPVPHVRSVGYLHPNPVPHLWGGRSSTSAVTSFFGQFGTVAGSCSHQQAIHGNLLQDHLKPGVVLFLHPYLLISL